MKWTLPSPREFGWKMKTLKSAKTKFVIDNQNVFRLTIEHDPIKGITPAMLRWWFEHIGETMIYQGNEYPRYLVWHPYDHIHWQLAKKSPKGDASQGSSFHIVEAFGRNMKYLVDGTEEVVKLDDTGIRLIKKIAGVEVFSLQHDFIPINGGTLYVSNMVVGTKHPVLKFLFNRIIRPSLFTEKMGHAWLKHNIEEVGNFEFFLADLYQMSSNQSPLP